MYSVTLSEIILVITQMTKAKRVYWEAFRGSDSVDTDQTPQKARSGHGLQSLHLGKKRDGSVLLLCSHSPNDGPPPHPEPQRNVSIAVVRGAVRPSKMVLYLSFEMLSTCRGVARPNTLLKQTYFEE